MSSYSRDHAGWRWNVSWSSYDASRRVGKSRSREVREVTSREPLEPSRREAFVLPLTDSPTSRLADSSLGAGLEQHHAGRSESEHGGLAGAGGSGVRRHAHHRAA